MMMMMERSPKHVVFSKSVFVCVRERERDIPKFVVC